jgi:hypothetical protein
MSEHDDKGLYGKYIVLKPEPFPGVETTHRVTFCPGEGCEDEIVYANLKKTPCFVLSPEKRDDYGEASRMAMQMYAMMIRHRNPQLADDIEDWLVKTYAHITDDAILASHGVEIKEGGTLTTDPPVEIPPDAPRLKVEMDLSGLEKGGKEDPQIMYGPDIIRQMGKAEEIECECGWKGYKHQTVEKDGHPGERYCPKCGECVTNLCFPEDGRYDDGRA